MLKLQKINKEYKVADYKVEALKDINLTFRESEFVSILGPSGSGKTTLLNIIGGLDKYSSGNLIINGRETKDYSEKDWNVYRSHRVGFVFQSYNLIPHQTVLGNVELALTIAGISKEERIKRAKDALDKVGLHDQYYKRPNQLSGGQSQRVAIARAIVNDPEILLADEPTGALDTETSLQIMDLIKEIASDRLVIMVTHNPDLAKKYSTRIVTLLDGELQSDSDPVKEEVVIKRRVDLKSKEKAKMSWWTSFKLSLQNLFSKKSRTILTSVASAIGIIGISLVLSLSFGVKNFMNKTQDDMLSGNPITISTSALNLESMMQNMGPSEKLEVIKEINKVGIDAVIKRLAESSKTSADLFVENTITEEYIEYLLKMPEKDVAAIFLNREIDVNNNIYMSFEGEDGTVENISVTALKTIITSILMQNDSTKAYASLISNFTNIINEAPDNSGYILSQYDIVSGKIAENKDEIMLVLNKDGLISDLTLAQLGYYSQKEFQNMIFDALEDGNYDPTIPIKTHFDYDDLLNKTFRWHDNDAVFNQVNLPEIPFTYNAYEEAIITNSNSLDLKVVGILEPKDEIEYGSLRSGFYYTKALSDYIININKESTIIKHLELKETENIPGISTTNAKTGVIFDYYYTYLEANYTDVGIVGKTDQMSDMISGLPGMENFPSIYSLSKRDLGGEEVPSLISVYPVSLETKDNVVKYLNGWNEYVKTYNEEATEWNENNPDDLKELKDEVIHMDSLSIIFLMISNIINVITIALIGFTSLALFVSSVMIAIITYVSVVERIKEIGVIRSLGGSKNDVSNLFISETFILGLGSSLIAIGFTYIANIIINIIVKPNIGSNIAIFPVGTAFIMMGISILLTLISGFIPSRSAAKKDPVVALRSE